MFNLFRRDPLKKMRKQYDAKLKQAMLAQRRGDIRTYSQLTSEAEKLWAELEAKQKSAHTSVQR